jgi:hypothetical protein
MHTLPSSGECSSKPCEAIANLPEKQDNRKDQVNIQLFILDSKKNSSTINIKTKKQPKQLLSQKT